MAESTTPTASAQRSTTRKSTPRTAAAKAAATRRSTAGKKAATTRARGQGASARAAAERRAERTVQQTAAQAERRASRVQDYAEKAVLVPVGAALVARDNVVSTIDGLRSKYSTRAKAERELKRFERRGTSALNSVEREVKKTRTRVERELRSVTRTPANKQAGLVGARVEHAVQSGILTSAQVAAKVQDRLAGLV